MHVIVAGGGTIGQRVVQAVHAAGNTVAIVEDYAARAAELADLGLQVVTGEACAPGRLEAAGALHAYVLVASTGRDEDNLLVAVLARRHFEIPRIVATVRDDANRWLFDASWGVDAAISAASALVTLIEEATGSAQTVRRRPGRIGPSPGRDQHHHRVGGPRQDRGRPAPAAGRHGSHRGPPRQDHRGRSGAAVPRRDRVLVVTRSDGEKHVHDAFYPSTPARRQVNRHERRWRPCAGHHGLSRAAARGAARTLAQFTL
jgi:hypothetical protein